jgi:hypothetical protein
MTRNISHGKEPRVDESTTQAYGTGDPAALRAQPGRPDDDLVAEPEEEQDVQMEDENSEAPAQAGAAAEDEDEDENLADVGGP